MARIHVAITAFLFSLLLFGCAQKPVTVTSDGRVHGIITHVTDGDTEAVLKGEALTDASVVATALALVVPHGERDALGNADGSPVVLVLVVADTLKGRGGTHARSVALPEAPAPPVDEPLPTNVVTPATTG